MKFILVVVLILFALQLDEASPIRKKRFAFNLHPIDGPNFLSPLDVLPQTGEFLLNLHLLLNVS